MTPIIMLNSQNSEDIDSAIQLVLRVGVGGDELYS